MSLDHYTARAQYDYDFCVPLSTPLIIFHRNAYRLLDIFLFGSSLKVFL